MQLFGTSFNVDLGNLRLRMSIGIDERETVMSERETSPSGVRLEDMPRLEIGKY